MHEDIEEVKETIAKYNVTHDENAREVERNEVTIDNLTKRNALLVRMNEEIVKTLFLLRLDLDSLLEEKEN